MHIPTADTDTLELLPFREALEKSGQRGDYDAARWLYVPDFYTEYRYILGTRGEKPLICIGVNPSTAAPDALDPTLQSVQRIALSNGYDSFIMFNVSQVSINEAFSPLLGMDVTLNNNMTIKGEYRQTRVLNLSMTSVQVNEALSKDWVVGMGYRINNINLFGAPKAHKVKGRTGAQQNSRNGSKGKNQTLNYGPNHDLNLRLDFSFRKQAAIVRDIATMTSSASSGNNALKLSFTADYTLSKMLTMSFYYDRQTNTPLLSSSSYPTTTQDFGLSIKFSLTR